MANGTAFDRIQALLQAIQTPEGLQQAAQQLAAQNVPAPDVNQVKQIFGANIPQPNQQALNRAAPQAAFNQGVTPQTNPGGIPDAFAPQPQLPGVGAIPSPQLQRTPIQAQQALAFSQPGIKGTNPAGRGF